MATTIFKSNVKWPLLFMAFCLGVTVINCKDVFTWFLETAPVIIGMVLIWVTRDKFPLTKLLTFLICIHSLILSVGGHYTYAEVPFGFWVQDVFHFSRNHYDRLGHFAQGFVPAILAREIFIRRKIVNGDFWVFILSVSVCLAFSAFYELVEWWTALISGEGATAFLGTQGDIWDTQWDMCIALIGAITAQLLLKKIHDKQLKNISVS